MRGHIRKRSKDSWTVVIDLGRNSQTRKRGQIWRTVRGTKRDAEALLTQLIHQKETGVDSPPGKLSVADYLTSWLGTYAEPNTAPRTYQRYEQLVRSHLTPAIGAIVLTKLRPLHIQHVYGTMLDQGLSARTVLQAHRVLREALHHAVRWQLLSRNPADAVEPPRFRRYEPVVLGLEDLRRLLACASETRYGPLVHTAATTGLRLGELLGLRWQDVNFDAGAISVRQTCQWLVGQGFVFQQPKTHRSSRSVALSPATNELLRVQRRNQVEDRVRLGPAYRDHDLVFATAVGTPINPSNLSRDWRLILQSAGLQRVRFHDLRHAHATLLLMQGVHPKVVSERLGHAGVSITLDTYSHVMPGLQASAALSFEKALANG